ncbi:MAG: DNA-binding protein WhiA [Anaerorhabdus sp.]
MSFTQEVKQEIAHNELRDCCKRAKLSALIQFCSVLNISHGGLNLVVTTENATTAKNILQLLKSAYSVNTELSVIKKMKLKKNNIYQIKVFNKAKVILEDLGLYSTRGLLDKPLLSIVVKECCARAYLAGAFMASGSVNAPTTSNYHLEISTNNVSHANFVVKLMERFYLPAKIVTRRKNEVVYLKAADKIGDFLRCIAAFNALMKFEDIRIQRDFKNSLTRLDNCELANEVKTHEAAQKQLKDIELIESCGYLKQLDEKLIEIVELRKENPQYSLNELSKEYEKKTGILMSKSGMKHRLKKIELLALKIKEKERAS